jgi:hypothetical protein
MPGVPPDPEIQRIENRRTGALHHLRDNPVLRRKVFLLATGAAGALTIVITVILTALAWTAKADLADRVAEAGAIFAGAALFLAAIAAVVALLAYAVSTGLPDVLLKVEIPGSTPNNLTFEARIDEQVGLLAEAAGPLTGKLFLRNLSSYSANNPAVIIRLCDMVFRRSVSSPPEWVLIDYDEGGITKAIQWDGGPAYSIHGNSIRRLPDFPLGYLWYTGKDGSKPMITVEILAEGYRKVRSLPVDFIVKGRSRFPREDTEVNPEWI